MLGQAGVEEGHDRGSRPAKSKESLKRHPFIPLFEYFQLPITELVSLLYQQRIRPSRELGQSRIYHYGRAILCSIELYHLPDLWSIPVCLMPISAKET